MSTTDENEVKRIGKKVIEKKAIPMDGPVSGGCHRAATGNIAIFVGWERKAFEKILPALTVMGRKILHTGELGTASVLKVITNLSKAEFFSDIVMRETGTLGVRVYPISRFIQMRENVKINVRINDDDEEIDVKVVKSESGEIIQFKPEFDQIIKLSEKHKMNLIVLKDDISKQIQKELFN